MTIDVLRDVTHVMDSLSPDQNQLLDRWSDRLQSLVNVGLGQGGPAARRMKNWLNGVWLGHPLHPALTDVTLGAWSTGYLLDIVGARGPADAATTVGVLSAVPTALAGAADWSDTSNPNGVWSYLVNGAVPPSGIRGGDVFGVPTPIWGTSSFEGWSRSNGDVFGHTLNNGDPMQIRWTSPTAGFIDVTGAVWGARDILRYNNWSISLNGIPLYLGVVGSGDPYSRSSPRSILLPSRHSGQYRQASKAEQKQSSRSHRRPARGLGSDSP